MHSSSKNDDSFAIPGRSRKFSSIHIAPLSARRQAGRDALGPSLARHTPFAAPKIRWLWGWPLVYPAFVAASARVVAPSRLARSLERSLSQTRQRRRVSQRPLSLPHPRCGHQLLPKVISLLAWSRTCPFGSKATVLPGLRCMPLAVNSRL